MPWKVSGGVEKRKQFLAEYESEEWTMTDLCQAYGISRQTGYQVLRRYRQAGDEGLEERSRAPHRHPNQTAAQIEEQVLGLRRAHMRWGPRKLKAVLQSNELTPAERQTFVAATRPIYQDFQGSIGADLIDQAIKALGPA